MIVPGGPRGSETLVSIPAFSSRILHFLSVPCVSSRYHLCPADSGIPYGFEACGAPRDEPSPSWLQMGDGNGAPAPPGGCSFQLPCPGPEPEIHISLLNPSQSQKSREGVTSGSWGVWRVLVCCG